MRSRGKVEEKFANQFFLKVKKMVQRTRKFQGQRYSLFSEPIDAQVDPKSVKNLPVPPSGLISIIGFREKKKLVLFAKRGSAVPIDRLWVGHLVDPPEELAD